MIATIAHKITAFILVFILFAPNLNTLVIIGDFMVNQAVIAKNLCIQKDNQQGCNGKCQLTKQINEITSNSNTDLPALAIDKTDFLFGRTQLFRKIIPCCHPIGRKWQSK